MNSAEAQNGLRHHVIELADLRLHYVRQGQGPVLLLLHEPEGFWWDWSRNVRALSDHFDVIVPDLRGCGSSEKPSVAEEALYKVDRIVDDTVQLLQKLDIDKAYVVGHGWSTMVVHKLIRRHRALIPRAVMLNAVLPGFEENYFSASNAAQSWYPSFWKSGMANALVGADRAASEAFSRWRLSHCVKQNAFDKHDIQSYTDNFLQPGNLPALQAFYRANVDPGANMWDPIDKTVSSCNVTILQGVRDVMFPPELTGLASRWYSRPNFEYVPDAGHFLMREEPDWLTHRLRLLKA
jgi:pimeloyl-ACP methyl ester carboxylesterase